MSALAIPVTRTLIEIADDYSFASDTERHEFKLALKEVWTSYDNEIIDVWLYSDDLYQIGVVDEVENNIPTCYFIDENNQFVYKPSSDHLKSCFRCEIVKEPCCYNNDFDINICRICASSCWRAKRVIDLYKLKKLKKFPQFFCSYSIKS